MTGIDYEYRTGLGTDIHRLAAGRELKLGGIHIPYPLGLMGHSDGDAVLHAVIDSLLGAACMGDIGTLFPDKDEKWKDIDSRELLHIVSVRIEELKWKIVNIDITIQAQEPRLEPHKGQIKRCISSILGINFMNVNVKAKTNEGLGEIGEGRAISALAIVLLKRRSRNSI